MNNVPYHASSMEMQEAALMRDNFRKEALRYTDLAETNLKFAETIEAWAQSIKDPAQDWNHVVALDSRIELYFRLMDEETLLDEYYDLFNTTRRGKYFWARVEKVLYQTGLAEILEEQKREHHREWAEMVGPITDGGESVMYAYEMEEGPWA